MVILFILVADGFIDVLPLVHLRAKLTGTSLVPVVGGAGRRPGAILTDFLFLSHRFWMLTGMTCGTSLMSGGT